MEHETNREQILIHNLDAKLKNYLEKVGPIKYHEWRRSLLEVIDKHYPDRDQQRKYKLYQFLIGGSWTDQRNPNFDFEGECSIMQAIEKLEI